MVANSSFQALPRVKDFRVPSFFLGGALAPSVFHSVPANLSSQMASRKVKFRGQDGGAGKCSTCILQLNYRTAMNENWLKSSWKEVLQLRI